MRTKNKYIWKSLLMACLVVFSSFSFTSCDNDDDDKSNQIVLLSFGPSPALRGGELRFIGNNLEKVTAVVIPGTGEITDITRVGEREIKVTIPQDSEVGYVTLKTPQGDITTKTMLSYEEPIVVDKSTATLIKAGEVFTIEGDYLNLIAEVIFFDNVVVAEPFVSQTRKKIEVIVPREAKTGKVRVSNGAEMPIEVYSDTEAKIVTATVTAVSPATVKPGETVKISGTDLDLIGSVVFAGGATAEFEVPEVNEENTELTVTVPLEAQDGPITVVARSGLEYPLETELTMVIPTNLKATPNSGIKLGDVITITGVNLDLVTNVSFPNVDGTFDLISQSATEIKVTVPILKPIPPEEEGGEAIIPEGVRSGDLVLNMANGKTATVAFKLLQPVVSNYNPSPVMAGSDLTVTGTNMDLVVSVIFTDGKKAELLSGNSGSFTVKVPVDAETGKLLLVMANGEEVEAPVVDITTPVACFIPVLPEEEILGGEILTVEVVNGDKLIGVEVNDQVVQYILQGSTLNILVPGNASAGSVFKLISSNGEMSYTLDVTPAGIVIDVLWEGRVGPIDWSGSHFVPLDVTRLAPGKTLGIDIECADSSKIEVMGGSWWEALPSWMALNGGERYIMDVNSSDTNIEFTITQEDIDCISKQGTALLFCGGGVTIARLYIY